MKLAGNRTVFRVIERLACSTGDSVRRWTRVFTGVRALAEHHLFGGCAGLMSRSSFEVIRKATPNDLPGIVAIHQKAFGYFS